MHGKAKELSDEDLIDIVKKAKKIAGKTGSAKINKINNDAIEELKVRGYELNKQDDGGFAIIKDGENKGQIEGGDMVSETSVYTNPKLSRSSTASEGLDDMISAADSFIEQGQVQYKQEALQNFSSTLFNIFSIVGVAVALIVGIIIGIKYMTGSIEEKADYKQMLVPYIVGCVVVFGAFGIWKIVIEVLENSM